MSPMPSEPRDHMRAPARRRVPSPARSTQCLLASALLVLAALLPAHAAGAGACGGAAHCVEAPAFTATLTEFRRAQGAHGWLLTNATVRFHNRTDRPLTLGYVERTALVVDDQGNRFEIGDARTGVRAIGVVTRREFDPKFTLAPGESADARFELRRNAGQTIHGTVYDFELAVREIDPVAGNQYRLGREHSLGWRQLQDGLRPAAAAAGATSGGSGAPTGAGAAPAAVAPALEDPCGERRHCSAAGPVLAEVVRLQSEAEKANNHGVVLTVRFRNLSNGPLVLNYKDGTGTMVDEHGNRYTVRAAEVQGMPVSTRDRASSGFTLSPGEARNATFRFRRFSHRTQIGRVFSPDFAVEQYELLPSNQLRLVREYSLSFPDVQQGGPGAAAGTAGDLEQAIKGINELFKKKR